MSYSLYIRKHNSIYYAEISKNNKELYTLTLFQDALCSVNEMEVLAEKPQIPFLVEETLSLLKNELIDEANKISSFTSDLVYRCFCSFLDYWKIPDNKKPSGGLEMLCLTKVQLVERLENLNHLDWLIVAEKNTRNTTNSQFGYIKLYNNDLLSLEIEDEKIIGKRTFFNEKIKKLGVVKVKTEDIQNILFHNIGIRKKGRNEKLIKEIIKERKIERDEIELFNQIIAQLI